MLTTVSGIVISGNAEQPLNKDFGNIVTFARITFSKFQSLANKSELSVVRHVVFISAVFNDLQYEKQLLPIDSTLEWTFKLVMDEKYSAQFPNFTTLSGTTKFPNVSF
jgi:hypothetical protein